MKYILIIICFLAICSCRTDPSFQTVVHFKHMEPINGGLIMAASFSMPLSDSEIKSFHQAIEKLLDRIDGTYPSYLHDFVYEIDPWFKYDEFTVKLYGDSLHIWETRRGTDIKKGWFYLTPNTK